MNIYFANIDLLSAAFSFEQGMEMLSEKQQEYILQYQKAADRWRGLTGKLLLQHVLKKENLQLNLDELVENEKGRPYFENQSFDFNISHSGKFVVLLWSERGACGIDVEMHRAIDYTIFRRNFTECEWAIIEASEDSDKQFFDFWSIKESVIKADGGGFSVLHKTEIQSDEKAICGNEVWNIRPLFFDANYAACLATQQEIKTINYFNLDLSPHTILI